MKTGIVLFSTLLLLWVAGSSYVYVCKIRKDCCVEKITMDSLAVPGIGDTLQTAIVSAMPVPALHTIYFDFNKSTCDISTESNSHFALISQYLSENPDKKVNISGHSDAKGSALAKMKVSSSRAEFVKQKLIETGIDLKFIDVTNESDNKPVSDNDTPEGCAKNRRVEIQIQ